MHVFYFSQKLVDEFHSKLKVTKPDDILQITVKSSDFKNLFRVKEYRTKKRRRRVVETGWTSALSGIVWTQLKVPCCLRWKYATVRQTDILCEGSCSEPQCDVTITCIAKKKKLSFALTNYDADTRHSPKLKRRMDQLYKRKVVSLLKGKSAFAVNIELADELMEAGDPHCPLVPTTNTLRIAKHRSEAPRHQSVIDGLLTLKKEHPDEIGSIGLDPFHLFYCTELQKAFYKNALQGKQKVTLCIDATGLGMFNIFD